MPSDQKHPYSSGAPTARTGLCNRYADTHSARALLIARRKVYDSCACSPIGKLKKQSMPHAPGATPQWIVYNYDGLGRTVSVVQPDTSTKSYSYSAHTVLVTDEAQRRKTYTVDAFGNLTQVIEWDPEGTGTQFTTTYAYDMLDHLTTVTMPRPSGTQTRSFSYGNPPGHSC